MHAAADLVAGAHDLAASPALVGDALFHAQQAAEKAMKGFLAWHDVPFRRTHDLGELGLRCLQVDPSLEQVCRRAESLTVFAWIFRYPTDAPAPAAEEAADGIARAREVHDAVTARLPTDARP